MDSQRILALDVGDRRIGLAITDPLGLTAQPLFTLHRTTLRADLKPRGVQVVGAMPVQTDTPAYAPLPEPKLKPEEVASDTLDAREAGEEEVFPGALSRGAAESFRGNPAALQAHLSTMVHTID